MKKWNDSYLNEIEILLKQGAKDAYEENINWRYEDSDFSSRMIEYVVVVNIAKKLWEWIRKKDYQIQLEYSIRNFSNGAFTYTKSFKDLTNRQIRNEHNPAGNKSGRIDLAITSKPESIMSRLKTGYVSLVGIEIKSINAYSKTIGKDVERLSYCISKTDKISSNSINACYSMFYRRLDKNKEAITEEEITNRINEEESKWNEVLQDYNKKFQSLNYELIPFEIKKSALEEVNIDSFTEAEDLITIQTGIVMCFLIRITRK